MVWTVNKEEEMMEVSILYSADNARCDQRILKAVRWDVHAILTDVTWVWLELRRKLKGQ